MDLYDRKIIGWTYGKNITAELATQAVKNACLSIPDTTGIVLHSDLGSQYTSEEFEKYLVLCQDLVQVKMRNFSHF